MKIHKWRNVIEYFFDINRDLDFLWDYVTALRGDDNECNVWKYMVTCLIRGRGLNGIAFDIGNCKFYLDNHTIEKWDSLIC